MRRILLLLIVLLLVPLSALCESGAKRLAQLDIISQRDQRLTDEKYFYQGMLFRIAGCKPSSVTNAFVSLLGTPETDVPTLLRELMRALNPVPDSNYAIELSRLLQTVRTPRDSAVELKKLLEQVSVIEYADAGKGSVAPSLLLSRYKFVEDAHLLMIREMRAQENWGWLVEMATTLCETGHPDARFVLCTASVGTTDTDGPFRSGQSGHYVTLYFEAEEFHKEGTIYLLDSYPRALTDEPYGETCVFRVQYPFISDTKKPFYNHYDVTRISNTVLEFNLNVQEQERLLAIEDKTSETYYYIRQKQAETLVLFDRTYFMLYLP